MIAGQKLESLASLAEGDAEAGYQTGGATESQLVEMAGYINSRGSLIAALAMLLALSVVTNVVFLATR